MSKTKWKNLINKQLIAVGLHDEAFESTVESLASILEQRDKTFQEFQQSGGKSVIEYTNKGGSTNMTKNPLLVLWDDLNKTALAYWRELGLTPLENMSQRDAAELTGYTQGRIAQIIKRTAKD